MNPKYNIQDWIDRYLNDEMNESEKQAFEAQLSVDHDLASALEAQKVVNKIVIGQELIKLKAQMASDLSSGNYSRGIQGKTWRYLFMGAGVVIIAVILYFLIKDRSEINKTGIVEEETTLIKTIESSQQASVDSALQDSKEEKDNSLIKQKNIQTIQNQKHQKAYQNKKYKDSYCTDSVISFSCQARGTCIQKNDGAIEIDVNTIKSANAPFLFSVNSKNDFHKEPIIADLKSGTYTLYVKDSKQCLHELGVKVEVPIIDCDNNPSK